jgi:2-methylcitrate dehydratase PrpD
VKSSDSSIAESLARFVKEYNFKDLPDDIVSQARLSILDLIGVTIRGSLQESTQIARDLVLACGSGLQSTLLGTGQKVSALDAAFVNGISAHSLELDDHISHARSLGHPGVVSVPAAIALGEHRRVSGETFVAAVVHGYEVTSRLNDVVPAGFDCFARGFSGTAITGTFGAAALSAKILDSTVGSIVNAFGICGSLTAGSFEYNVSGAWTKRLHAGQSSRNGLLAALLAAGGFTGPRTAIEGQHGFLNSYFGEDNYDASLILEDLGDNWALRHMMYKPFACAGILHSPMTAMRNVMRSNDIDFEDIERIVVHTASTVIREMTNPPERKVSPRTSVDAQLSLPYAVAVMAVRGKALVDEFIDDAIADPKVRDLARRVDWVADPEIDRSWPNADPSTVSVVLRDGREFTAAVAGAKGSLEVPMTPTELTEKFMDLASPVIGERKARNVAGMVERVETLGDISSLVRLLYPEYS